MKGSTLLALLTGAVIGATAVLVYENRKELNNLAEGIKILIKGSIPPEENDTEE